MRVLVPMMQIGIVRVPVYQRSVPMTVRVRLGRDHVDAMRMPMVFVMDVSVFVLEILVGMLVFVALGQVKR